MDYIKVNKVSKRLTGNDYKLRKDTVKQFPNLIKELNQMVEDRLISEMPINKSMDNTELAQLTIHDELLKLIIPLVEFMDNNGFSYFLVAGKDGTACRYMKGDFDEVGGMLISMAEKTPQVQKLLTEVINITNKYISKNTKP